MADVRSSPMQGRDHELALLLRAYGRAQEGEPRVVVLVGEAGIGKSRLVDEIATRVRADGGRAIAGACLDLADGGLPLAPMAEAMRAIARTEAPDVLAGLVDDGGRVPGLLPGAGLSSTDEPLAAARLYEGALGLLRRLGESLPTLLVFEDVHWVDRATRDLVTFLVRNLTDERLFLVLTARSDDVAAETAGWLAEIGRHPRVERLVLARLDRNAVRAQLTVLAGGVPGRQQLDRIFARSEGNPFFVEELVAGGGGELPDTVVELITARLSQLSADAREAVRLVAIGGRSIDEALVAAVTDRPLDEIRGSLREAVEHRILVGSSADTRIGFRHALVREVAAAELLTGEQAALHARLATVLAERPELAEPSPAGAAAELAYHWEAAGDDERALGAAIEAGAASARVAAWADADRQYERALRLAVRASLPAGMDTVELHRRASEAAELNGDVGRARELAEMALASVDASMDSERMALLLTRLGYLRWAEGNTDAALAAYERAAGLLPADPPTALRGRVLASLANALFGQGRYEEARHTAEEAVATTDAAQAGPEAARARNVLGSVLVATGDVDAGLAELERSRDLATEHGPADMRVVSAYNLAVNLAMAGRLAAAEVAARQGREAAQAEGLERRYGPDLAALEGDVLTRIGRWDEADAVMRAAIALDPEGNGTTYLAIAIARLHALRGAADEAHEWFARVERMAGEHIDADLAGYLARARAELALVERRADEALATCQAGLAPLEGTEDHFVRSPLLVLAISAAGDVAEAARARRDQAALDGARAEAAPLLSELRAMQAASAPTVGALVSLAEAEWSRLEDGTDPDPWRVAAPLLAAIPDPHAAAVASFRAAEAALRRDGVRAAVADELRTAATTASALRCAPLQRAVDDLARRSRTDLTPRAEPSPPPDAAGAPAPQTNLSRREIEVLRLVADGRTNGEIAEELFITRKTAGVHVTHILDKLGVANRVEAAMAASRLGLLEDEPAAADED
jgi:DNA-binding CsgD family transcriptional regulator/tetratricopeptide (TPR) repeat protein